VGRGIKRSAFSGFFQAAGLDAKPCTRARLDVWLNGAGSIEKQTGFAEKIMDRTIGV
jgi:hypothetical protein